MAFTLDQLIKELPHLQTQKIINDTKHFSLEIRLQQLNLVDYNASFILFC